MSKIAFSEDLGGAIAIKCEFNKARSMAWVLWKGGGDDQGCDFFSEVRGIVKVRDR